MLHEDYVHFLFGAKIYAVHRVHEKPYRAHLQVVNGEQSVSYFPMEYDQLPDQVKRWWTEFKEKTSSEGRAAVGDRPYLEHCHSEVEQ